MRERPQRVLRKARRSLSFPTQWAVKFNKSVPQGGVIPVAVIRSDGVRFVIDIQDFAEADWNDPLRTLPIKMEGTLEAYALLYIPSKAPFDLYSQEGKRGLQLYVKRVFVMDECRDLMPTYLRFVKGVVDAHDLSLNVSREILQKDRQIQIIRKQLVKKVLAAVQP